MRIAVNGMGRIGRLLFRRLVGHESIEVVAVNDIMPPANLLYLLKYDSVYGNFPGSISLEENNTALVVNGRKIKALHEEQPAHLPWSALGVDIVLECSGRFTSKQAAGAHLEAGAHKILLSTTGSADIPLLIYGHNHHVLNGTTQ